MNPHRKHETIPRKGAPGAARRWPNVDTAYRYLSEKCFGQSEALILANSFNRLGIASTGKLVALPVSNDGEVRYIVASTQGQGDFRAKVDLFIAGFQAGMAQ